MDDDRPCLYGVDIYEYVTSISPIKIFFSESVCFLAIFKKSKLQGGFLRGDLGVGTNIVINSQLPDGIWQFQELFWNHERQSIQ